MNNREILRKAKELVDKQADDEGLWFNAPTITEAYLQKELRRLHAVIEDNDKDLAIIEGKVNL